MEYEFGKVCWINKGQRFGDKCIMIGDHCGVSIIVWNEKECNALMHDKNELSPTPPKLKVKKTVWVGITNNDNGKSGYQTSIAHESKDNFHAEFWKYGIHPIEIEVTEE